MALQDFGNSVDEVREKLKEILPLIDSGQDRAEELHESLAAELPNLESHMGDLEEALKGVEEQISQLAEDCEEVQSLFSDSSQEFAEAGDAIIQKFDEAFAAVDSQQDRISQELQSLQSEIGASMGVVTSQFGAISERVKSLAEELSSERQNAEELYSQLAEHFNDCLTRWEESQSAWTEAVENLQSDVADQHVSDLTEQFSGFQTAASEVVSSVCDMLTMNQGSLEELFQVFDTDVQQLAEDFQSRASEILDHLKEHLEQEMEEKVKAAFEKLVREAVEALAAEILLCVATSEVGVATTSALSPVLPELVAAKLVTGAINAIL